MPLQPRASPTGSLAATPHERGLLAATFYLAGGLATLLASLAPQAHTRLLAALGLIALTVAGVSYVLRHMFVYWATLASSGAGPLLIAAGIVAGNGSGGSAVMATLYTFVAVHAALVLRWEHAAVIQLWGVATAVTASWLVAPDLPPTVVGTTYLLVCGTLWGVTARLVGLVRRQAATDALTGLANRAAFTVALDHALATVQRTGVASWKMCQARGWKSRPGKHEAPGRRPQSAVFAASSFGWLMVGPNPHATGSMCGWTAQSPALLAATSRSGDDGGRTTDLGCPQDRVRGLPPPALSSSGRALPAKRLWALGCRSVGDRNHGDDRPWHAGRCRGPTPRPGTQFVKPLRQIVESVNQTLRGQLDPERHNGRTPAGVCTRIALRILALTAAIWHNDPLGPPSDAH